MGKKRYYTPKEIEIFRNDPNVKDVNEKRLRFTLEFRQKMYEAIKDNICTASVRSFLTAQGYDHTVFCEYFENDIAKNMKLRPPTNGGGITVRNTNKDDNDSLLASGLFVKARNGITFSDAFTNQLYHSYPEQSIEDGIRKAGIDPQMVGYQRIYTLERRFNGQKRVSREYVSYSSEIIRKYKHHPYIKRITPHQCLLMPCFFNEAYALTDMHIDDILSLYEFSPEDFNISTRNNILYKLRHWKKSDDVQTDCSDQAIRIQYARMMKLKQMLDDTLHSIGEAFPSLNPVERKDLCLTVKELPSDPYREYTVKYILKTAGIPRSTYYGILNNPDYEQNYLNRDVQDDQDVQIIRQVMEYKNIHKGSRQIYMNMHDITGVQFGLNKIRRLMKKYGMHCDIRKPNHSTKTIRELVKKNTKPNILRRRFRLFRPDEVRLTDVTYIDYGNGKRAYGSAVKDSVTGRIIDFTIMDTNDLNLVLTSVDHMEADGIHEGMIFHSDQGALYLTDTFQKRIADLGMIQSMSKRGNCWDNAPQESFFGHFKDEADYRACSTLEQLCECVNEYLYYYNHERRQWNLKRMTPVQYDAWLKSLSDEEYNSLMEQKEKEYQEMKEAAAIKAKNRANTLGV